MSAPRADAGDAASASPTASRALRRGLPRTPGGEPWPPAGSATAGAPTAAASGAADAVAPSGTSATTAAPAETPTAAPVSPAHDVAAADDAATLAATAGASTPADAAGSTLRRGLPRSPGGEPWPPAGTAVAAPSAAAAAPSAATPAPSAAAEPDGAPSTAQPLAASSTTPGADTPDAGPIGAERPTLGVLAPRAVTAARDVSVPLTAARTVWNGVAPRHAPAPASEGGKRPTWPQAIAGLLGLAGLGILGIAVIAFVRTILSTPAMMDFLAAFPGEYHLPEGTQPGIPGWVGWQHFFNVFLMVLIIRTGLTVRAEKRPTVFWTSRRNPKSKISLTLWLHQALDVLWLVNGVIFVVLLFTTGHWVRVVPTSWEVFPNALSAGLQYVSLDWPTENGWANYNSLQQLAYFATIFVAAPLATITGVRMSGIWPKDAEKLNRAYPVEWARAVHFPVMLYFIAFIVVHVILVMATGALRNLNHMYASQDLVSWTGAWVFIASLVVIAIGWVAARPLIVAPIAKGFGNVSGR
ncbi:cytochrome b/b6 domain-containing protein [Microbacterium sp. M28]|uniref:cytochrome b/b6 domain-containing protein n=1 Tax=Microbacterium sp. M28 TaxID=2962064 RepID=UPI00298FCB45|nr:cytochrome b/b6 domain-containing protein [Microbacterium sp. M28]